MVNKKMSVLCSCRPVKTLDLRNLSQEYLVSEASIFRLEDCSRTSVLVLPGAFNNLNFLEDVTFHRVKRLTLEPYSISQTSWVEEVFRLTFSLINNLSIRNNAINIQLQDQQARISLRIQQSGLISLMRSAVVGNLQELTLEESLVKARPWPGAIVCQGSEGTSVIMRSVGMKKGLTGNWITGNVSRLSITKSNLRLLPEAFAGVDVVGDIILSGNNFLIPSLPSQALPSNGSLLQAHKNYIVCQCQNLAWLLEPPQTPLKEGVKASLICRNKKLTLDLETCDTPAPPTV